MSYDFLFTALSNEPFQICQEERQKKACFHGKYTIHVKAFLGHEVMEQGSLKLIRHKLLVITMNFSSSIFCEFSYLQ